MPYPDAPLPIGPIGPVGHLEPVEQVSPIAEIHELGTLAQTVREGDVLTGRVLNVRAGRATVQLGDKQFEADVQDAVKTGDQVTAHAVKTGDRISLRLRMGQTSAAAAQRSVQTTETIAAHLRALGIEPSDWAVLAARTMRALGLGLDARLLNALIRLISEHGAFGSELAALAEALDRYAARADGTDRAATAAAAMRLRELFLDPDDTALAEKLSKLARDLGFTAESRLRASAETGTSIRETLADDLKWILMNLRNRLLGSVNTGDQAAERALAQLDRTLAMINAHQIEDVNGLQNGCFLLELPMLKDTGFDGARVRFFYRRGKPGEPAVDVNNCTVLIDLKMSRLGPLKVLLTVVRGNLSCQLISARPETVKLLNSESGALRTTLNALPFRLADVACVVAADRDMAAPPQQSDRPWPSGVDLSG